ncbi:MAG TPA: entericidin A/B family lipoprotein [Phycisphaerales bacterium]|nr:entericidin A/B family lipoprotein [Phycisphaerales bacterium]HMP35966.1 entericidin A/B family lipoprotein [Phycisphaerales bacterium]
MTRISAPVLRTALLGAAVAAALAVVGCNTVKGAGEDISAAGEGISKGAQKTEDAMSGNK